MKLSEHLMRLNNDNLRLRQEKRRYELKIEVLCKSLLARDDLPLDVVEWAVVTLEEMAYVDPTN